MRTRNLYGLIMDPHRILNGIGIPSSHRNGNRDTLLTDTWLDGQHIEATRLYDTPTKLIQAEARARELIRHYKAQLTNEQKAHIENFLRRMNNKRTRQGMKEGAGNSIFRMHTQLKRKQHRKAA